MPGNCATFATCLMHVSSTSFKSLSETKILPGTSIFPSLGNSYIFSSIFFNFSFILFLNYCILIRLCFEPIRKQKSSHFVFFYEPTCSRHSNLELFSMGFHHKGTITSLIRKCADNTAGGKRR